MRNIYLGSANYILLELPPLFEALEDPTIAEDDALSMAL
jgi:hypothetical protein